MKRSYMIELTEIADARATVLFRSDMVDTHFFTSLSAHLRARAIMAQPDNERKMHAMTGLFCKPSRIRKGSYSIKALLEMCTRLNGEDSSAISSAKGIKDRNPYAIISFVLGFLAGLYAILTGSDYYYAGWPAHGPVGVVGVFLMIFGLLTILGSFLVLSRRVRIVGAILILLFGIVAGMQGIFSIMGFVTKLLLPILSFIFALYATKRDRNSP